MDLTSVETNHVSKITSFKMDSYVIKSHTCEESGAHLRVSFSHLLINLKNKYLLKKLLKWANVKRNNFNIFNVAFKKIIKKNTTRYHYFTPVYQTS